MQIDFFSKTLNNLKSYIFIFSIILAAPLNIDAFQLNFSPSISINEEYTDNVFLSSHNIEHDYITSISPSVGLDFSTKRTNALISYTPSFVFYSRYDENDTVRHRAQFSCRNALGKNTNIILNNSFVLTEDPLGEEDIFLDTDESLAEPDTSIRQSREEYFTNTTTLDFTHQFGASNHFELGALFRILENDDPLEEDSKEWGPSMGLSYQIIPGIDIDTEFSYRKNESSDSRNSEPDSNDSEDDLETWEGSIRINKIFTRHFTSYIEYNHTIANYDGDREDYKVYEPLMGIRYTIAENTHINIGIGYFIQDREISSGEEGFSIDGDIGKTFEFKRGSINLTGSSGQHSSDFGSENNGFSIYYQVQSTGEYSLTERISTNARFSFREEKYTDLDDDKTDKTTRLSAGMSYAPTTWLFLNMDYSYNTVDSTDNDDEYDENRATLTVTLSPPRYFRLIK